jgi:hypothetical protein
MAKLTKKRFENADEIRTPPKVKVEVLDLGGATAMRGTFEPGWKWSESMKPVAGTDTCQVEHVGCVISGAMVCKMDDGTEITFQAGDAAYIPPATMHGSKVQSPAYSSIFKGEPTTPRLQRPTLQIEHRRRNLTERGDLPPLLLSSPHLKQPVNHLRKLDLHSAPGRRI